MFTLMKENFLQDLFNSPHKYKFLTFFENELVVVGGVGK